MHSGNVDCGHYRAVGLRANNVIKKYFSLYKWVIFDDERVKKITEKNIPKNEIYLLFYERIN